MGNCIHYKDYSPKTASKSFSNVYNYNIKINNKHINVNFLHLLIDKNNDIISIINLIDESNFTVYEIVYSIKKLLGLLPNSYRDIYNYNITDRVSFNPEENEKLLDLLKKLVHHKKNTIIKRLHNKK
jgi:hypothetical protein